MLNRTRPLQIRVKKLFHLLKRNWKKNKYNKYYRARLMYIRLYRTLPLDPHGILLECQHGSEVNGNTFYMLRELCENPLFRDYTPHLSVREGAKKKISGLLARYNLLEKVSMVVLSSEEYFTALASCKYLVNDNTFLPFFIKKEGQVYLNTWHGTPLKTLGRQIKSDLHNIGNTQKNFFVADYLLYPNSYTMEHMIADYMLENIAPGTCVLGGYPRNAAFFDAERRRELRELLQLEDKQVFAYMPTWRGVASDPSDKRSSLYMQYYLYELDELLTDHQVLYVNLHPIAAKDIPFRHFKRIRPFPWVYETYEFLNLADCLITDYSSVLFDFAVTGRKIILFTFDKESYLADRGLYLDLEALPFPVINTLAELYAEMNSEKHYDDSAFLQQFCNYENASAAQKLCRLLLYGDPSDLILQNIPHNGKENVLIFVGNLAKNGITSSIKCLLRNIDTEKRNYIITAESWRVGKTNMHQLLEFPPNVAYLMNTGKMNVTPKELTWVTLFTFGLIRTELYLKKMRHAYPYEIKRLLGDIHFDHVIHFTGYEHKRILLYSTFPCNRVIYVHSNMVQEIEVRQNQRRDVLEYAYQNYSKVALVTENMWESARSFNPSADRFMISRNIVDHQHIRSMAQEELLLEERTKLNVSEEEFYRILNSENKKFITIGRFSPEKGHLRLIDAFSRLWLEDPSIYLVIIGSYGVLYEETVAHAAQLLCAEHILIIRAVDNPYTILKRCHYFVLPSFHEGFGIVLAEADILGLPAISTDIMGPRGFMQEHGGTLVPDSEDGLFQGMRDMLDGKIAPMDVDYESYNREAVAQFEALLE